MTDTTDRAKFLATHFFVSPERGFVGVAEMTAEDHRERAAWLTAAFGLHEEGMPPRRANPKKGRADLAALDEDVRQLRMKAEAHLAGDVELPARFRARLEDIVRVTGVYLEG